MGQFNPLQRYFILLLSSLAIVATRAQDRSEVGEFSEPVPFGIVPVAVANLPDGRLLTWSSQFRNTFMEIGDGMTFTEIYDPFMGPDGTALGEFTSNTDHDMFCPGINNLADGRILSAGGTTSERTSIYDPKTGVWSVAQDMNIPRGYQGNVTLSNGAVFTVGGSWSGGAGNNGGKDAEIWSPLTGWVELPNITGEDIYTSNDLFLEKQGEYRVDNHIWLWPASNGKLFHAGPSERMHWIDTEAPGGEIVDAGPRGGDTYSMKGTTVMFDVDKILKVGGAESYGADFSSNTPAKDNSYVIDLNGTGYGEFPNVTFAGNLAFNRTMHNSTVLPDGTVLVTGGLDRGAVFTDQGSRLEAELFDPTNNSWTTMALMHEARTYHSVAILMTDGRVFVGGGGLCNNLLNGCENHFNAEIYSPPYLFNSDNSLAERPVITNINTGNAAGYYEEAVVDYGDVIEVTTDSDVTEFSLIRFSAATHSTNNEQRRIPLTGSGSRTHQLTIPNRNLLPPGYYMLFALDANGVPS
ncbi:MAG: galactose oxidase-like domain-containing protein, partial [Sediminicola sp.]